MKTYSLFALFLLSAALIAPAAHANEKESYKSESSVENHDNGGYKTKDSEEVTDANGTLLKKETTKDIKVDSKGNKEATVKTSTVTDPPGLMNKETKKTEDKTTIKDGKQENIHKKSVNGHTVEETKDSSTPPQ